MGKKRREGNYNKLPLQRAMERAVESLNQVKVSAGMEDLKADFVKSTQAELAKLEERMKKLQSPTHALNVLNRMMNALNSLQGEEHADMKTELTETLSFEIKRIEEQINSLE